MPWSIFTDGGGDAAAAAWAEQLLSYMGLPLTSANIQFVFDWEKSEGGGGRNNPLNQGPVPGQPGLTSTGAQYGGGAADYVSIEAGIQGAAAYLQMPAYASVLQALQGGNNYQAAAQALWASGWAASHYGYGQNWNSSGYPGVTSPITAASAQGMAGTTGTAIPGAAVPSLDLSGANVPAPPGVQDIGALDNYIRQYFSADSWLLDIPGVKEVIEKAVAEGRGNDAAYITGLLQSTPWFKSTSTAYQTYLQQSRQFPGDYNFAVAGSLANKTLADVMATAGTEGVQINPQTAQTLALNFLKYGWDQNQLKAALANSIYVTGTGAQQRTDAGAVLSQLQAAAGQYFMAPNDPVLQSWAQNIAAGTQTIEQFDAYMKQNAALKWTGMAGQLQQGFTPYQITSSLRSDAAKTMETDPNAIDFVNNPLYSKILDYVPPNSPNGVHRIMTNSEMDQYLKGTQQWSLTQQSRDQVGNLAQTLLTEFGKVAG